MKSIWIAALSAWCITAGADQLLAISAEQQRMLGIRTMLLDETTEVASDVWNARTQFLPNAEWMVTALLSGTIRQWAAAPGQALKKGDVLAYIHSDAAVELQREYLAALAQAQVDNAALGRDKNLFDNGVIAERRLLETRQRAYQQSLQVDALRQRLLLTGFDRNDLRQLESGRQLRADYPLRSPADAVVVERRGDLGEQVQSTTPLFHLGDSKKIGIVIQVPARYAARVNDNAVLQIIGGGTARVQFVNRAIDAQTQTITAMAALDGEPGYPAGTLLQVRSLGAMGLRIPANIVVRHNSTQIAFVSVKEGFAARAIKTATAADGSVVVQEGLSAGERVAVSGVAALKGMLVGMGGGE